MLVSISNSEEFITLNPVYCTGSCFKVCFKKKIKLHPQFVYIGNEVYKYDLLRLQDTSRIHTRCCAHNWLKMYCEQLAKNCSTVYYFSRKI